MTHGSVAKAVRLSKEKHPEQFCPVPNCLWRTKGDYTPCPKHTAKEIKQ
jgi:hypothetical protein